MDGKCMFVEIEDDLWVSPEHQYWKKIGIGFKLQPLIKGQSTFKENNAILFGREMVQ